MNTEQNLNPIEEDFFASAENQNNDKFDRFGEVSTISDFYNPDSDNLLGFLLKLDYQGMDIATCDPWKRKCGGVPRNSFILVKIGESYRHKDRYISKRIILARVTNSIPTPLDGDILNTLFEVHKAQVFPDPYTTKELQWSALKGSIIGTFFDNDGERIGFGNDVDTYFSAHAYEVYSPLPNHLELLINSFVDSNDALPIGNLRYTETPNKSNDIEVKINVDPKDFIGESYGQRTALFGKTRFGKSNTIKVIADSILNSSSSPGQLIFDPSGEYTYWNEQDKGSLFTCHNQKSVRYSLDPKLPAEERNLNLNFPELLSMIFIQMLKLVIV